VLILRLYLVIHHDAHTALILDHVRGSMKQGIFFMTIASVDLDHQEKTSLNPMIASIAVAR
jgi:hypothetical protein